jgi:epoxyqueuosine reductase
MGWMENRSSERASPRILWPEVRSIVMVGASYAPDSNPLDHLKARSSGLISVYAQGLDYHEVLKGRLKQLARALVERQGGDVKVFVDTAPVMEKPLAQAAGLGWQGKHTVLVSREYGSWLFLGALYTTLELTPDPSGSDHCGTCTRCLDICPTDAFPAPYTLDSRRCLAYYSIEHHGPIPRGFRAAMGNRIFGCDDCLAVCPWNKFAKASEDQKLTARRDIGLVALSHYLTLDDAEFRRMFAKTPVKRTGRDRFLRNVLIAAGNSGDPSLVPPVVLLLDDAAPVVRGAAVWALARLDGARLRVERHRMDRETDADVLVEWEAEA